MARTVRGFAAFAQALRAALPVALLAWLCAGCATAPAAPRGDDAQALERALDAADLGPLVADWAREPAASALRRCVLARLLPAAHGSEDGRPADVDWPRATGDTAPLTLAVSAAFADAWRGQLLGELDHAEAEQLLMRMLAGVSLEQHAGIREAVDPPLLGAALGRTLAGEGVGAFVLRRGPLLDLLLWRGEEVRRYDVALPDGRAEVQVRLLDEVLVHGVRDWASCAAPGVSAAGAEAEWSDGTQVLLARAGVDTEGEHFRAHVLARWAQWRWDDATLPALDEAERHYRVALAELARVEGDGLAQAALARLLSAARQGRGDPGAHAAWAAVQALAQRLPTAAPEAGNDGWRTVRAGELRQAAEALLRASTRIARAVQDGERVRFLPD